MTLEEKQLELLKRQYVNIEYYKSLRIKIPASITSLILVFTGYIIGTDNLPKDNFQKLIFSLLIIAIGLFGILSFRFIHNQYKDIVEDIHYLWDKLDIRGEKFFKENKGIKNPLMLAPSIFIIGYASIILISLIGIVLMYTEKS
jgi:hypothetical protein